MCNPEARGRAFALNRSGFVETSKRFGLMFRRKGDPENSMNFFWNCFIPARQRSELAVFSDA